MSKETKKEANQTMNRIHRATVNSKLLETLNLSDQN